MKIFGCTQHVKVVGQYKDVEPNEPYLQLEVKSMWDLNSGKHLVLRDSDFEYYVKKRSKSDNSTYSSSRTCKAGELTDDEIGEIENYLKQPLQ